MGGVRREPRFDPLPPRLPLGPTQPPADNQTTNHSRS